MNANTLRRLNWLWKHRHTHDGDTDCCAQIGELRLQIDTVADIRQHTRATPGQLADESRTYTTDAIVTDHEWPVPTTNLQPGDHIYTSVMQQTSVGNLSINDVPDGNIPILVSNAGTQYARYIYYKVADGTEADGTFTTPDGSRISLISWRLAANGGTLGVPEVAGPNTLNDPDPIAPTTAPGLHAAFVVHMPNGGNDLAVGGPGPENYTTVDFVQSAGVLNRPKVYVAQRAVDILTSEDPGPINWTDAGTGSFRNFENYTVATRLDTGSPQLMSGDADHDVLGARNLDDNHPQYSLTDGTRPFTGTVVGVTPTSSAHLATKAYVDSVGGGGGGGGVTPIQPDAVTGLDVWLDADAIAGLSDTDPVATWADQSGNGNDFTQGTGANQPLYRTGIVNSLPVVRFDATNDGMTSSYTLSTTYTVIAVYRYNGTTSAQRRMVQGSTNWLMGPYTGRYQFYNGSAFVTAGPVAVGWNIHTVYRPGTLGSQHYVNGIFIGAGASGTNPGLRLGASGAFAEPADSDLAEFIVYDNAISPSDLKGVEAYLFDKYGI